MNIRIGLPGFQQDTGFSRIDAVDEPDTAERLIEGDEIAILKLGDEIPFAVGAVQRAHLRETAQLIGYSVGELAEYLDHDDGTNAGGARFMAGPDGKSGYGAACNKPVDTGGNGRARRASHRGERGYRRSRIMAKRA